MIFISSNFFLLFVGKKNIEKTFLKVKEFFSHLISRLHKNLHIFPNFVGKKALCKFDPSENHCFCLRRKRTCLKFFNLKSQITLSLTRKKFQTHSFQPYRGKWSSQEQIKLKIIKILFLFTISSTLQLFFSFSGGIFWVERLSQIADEYFWVWKAGIPNRKTFTSRF